MIQQESILEVADNSGAKRVRCIKVLGGSKRRYAGVGDIIVCSVQNADPNGDLKKKQIVKAVIVCTRKPKSRGNGIFHRFDRNACVPLDDKGNPRGTRIFGPIDRKVRERGFIKLVSLAPEVI